MIVIPVYHWYVTPILIIWGFFWLYQIKRRILDFKHIEIQNKLLLIVFIIFYIWQIIGILYSDNTKEGWRNIVLRLPFILFPLFLISPEDKIQQNIMKLLRIFALSTFFYLIVCFGYAFYRSLYIKNGILVFNPNLPVETWLNYFYGSEFAFSQHPSYLSMYILFSVYIAFESFFVMSVSKTRRMLWLAVVIVFLFSIYLLSARADILATLLTVPFYLFSKMKKIKRNRIFVPVFLISIIILIIIFISNPRLNYNLKGDSKKEWSNKLFNESRFDIWESAFNIIRHNIVFGVGTGDIQDELNKEYKFSGKKDLELVKNLNTHNQFIEILVENGLIGLILFLSILGLMFFIAFSGKNIIYIMFLFIILFSFLFETMLNRSAGVSFFSFFSFILLQNNTNRQIKHGNTP